MGYLPTFQRWDGVWRPSSGLNRSLGEWPYLANETSTAISLTRIGRTFTQAKIPGAVYEYLPSGLKETAFIGAIPLSPMLSISFMSTYTLVIRGTAVSLEDPSGTAVWTTGWFHAWDSGAPRRTWGEPVTSISYVGAVLQLTLNLSMLAQATYPLYIDPTWILKAGLINVWAGTLDHTTSDWGDRRLKIGLRADNFDDNTNEIWTVTSGGPLYLAGGRAQMSSIEIHNASARWSDLKLEATANFTSSGVMRFLFRYKDTSNFYQFQISRDSQTVQLTKTISGTVTTISPSLATTISTYKNYSARVVALGNNLEIWWNGAKKWSGSDGSPPSQPLSGDIGFSVPQTATVMLDNVRAWNATRSSGNYTSPIRDAGGSNVATQLRYLGSADAYNSTDLWVNASADNVVWGGWHIAKSMAAQASYYRVPDIDQKRFYQVRAVLRSGIDGSPAVGEVDVIEAVPSTSVAATANTGRAPWYLYIGDTVNSVSGNVFLSWTDLAPKAKGFSLAFVRSYNSKLAGTSGPLGYGMTYNFNAKISAFSPGGNISFADGDGALYLFTTLGGNSYSPPPGLHFNFIKNPDGTYTLWKPDGSKTNFDSTGKLTRITDRNGNRLTMTYSAGILATIADDSGLFLTLSYDASNRITSVKDSAGRKVSYTYSASNLLTNVSDAMGFKENYTYDGSSRMTQRVDPAGHVDQFVYDSMARANQTWIGNWSYAKKGVWWKVRSHAISYTTGNRTDVTNAEGVTTTLYFNSPGNPTAVGGPKVGGPGCPFCTNGNSSAFTWDGELDRMTEKDGRGNTISHAFDWMGNELAITDPGGNTTLRTFANFQNTTQFLSQIRGATNPRGYTTVFWLLCQWEPVHRAPSGRRDFLPIL